MKILIASDAWYPQVNGVVRTLDEVTESLRDLGHDIGMLTSQGRRTMGLPGYPEIQLGWISQKDISTYVDKFKPDCIHIATEGPIGMAVRRWCLRHDVNFTTGYHTRFPEYVAMRIPLPGIEKLTYAVLRRFHGPSHAVLAPTPSITRQLQEKGFDNVVTWTRGVDHEQFRPVKQDLPRHGPGPVMAYTGRIAVEKGLEDFLAADVSGTKVVIGDGPARKFLQAKYPDAVFTGYKFGEDLTANMAACDVFVFPSRTDTFGLVLLEAMACGLPVAAYPVPGPIDVVEHGVSGWLDEDLAAAIQNAITLAPADAIARAAKFSWAETARQFVRNLARI